MIKMVVCSFYNTLIDKEDAIPTSTMLELDRLKRKGIAFSVCTNRLYQEVLDYNRDFPIIDYIISLNGSYIYDVEKQKVLSKSKLSKTTIQKITELSKDKTIYYYTATRRLTSIEGVEEDIYKIEVELETEDISMYEKINGNKSILEYDNKKYFEITSNKANPFRGVDQVSLKLNLSLEEILTVCGNESEIPLVHNIPRSYIVENSSNRLKKITKKITTSNNEKGVEQILKKI